MRWVYLSPHFDDVVLSCGGLVWEQVQAGETVQVWTVCAGAPSPGQALSGFAQQLHERWGTGLEAVAVRREEDETAVGQLGAAAIYWNLPDCIYRRLPDGSWLVTGEDDLWQPVHRLELGVVQRLADWLVSHLSENAAVEDTRLVSPLTLGNHVDHFLVRAAAERAAGQLGCSLWYYADYPYSVKEPESLPGKTGPGWRTECQPISRRALEVWQEAVASYASQLSTFWSGREALNEALESYWQAGGGSCLWKPG